MAQLIVFEHPLNERIRTFLRLEHLFEKIEHFVPQYDPWATRVAVDALIDITAITARSDIKSEITKELDRDIATLNRIARQPGVDPAALERILGELDRAARGIHGMDSPIGQTAREDDFLKAVAQRGSLPGGACSFDIPSYHQWLIQPPEKRQSRLDHWLQDLRPADVAIRLILSLARDSAIPRQMQAKEGFFQEALDPQSTAQLLRIGLSDQTNLYPEVSGNKTRFSIRFMQSGPRLKSTQCTDDVPFRLTCCVF